MELEKKNKLTCQYCKMEFSSTYCKNRHIRTKHPEADSTSEQHKRTRHIICPICTDEISFPFYKDLIKHLTNLHNVSIKESVLYFRNLEEFTVWRTLENKVHYACRTRKQYPDGKEQTIYDCNKSDSRGFVSSAKVRSVKTGGSIRIHGTCPSRIVVNVSVNGSVTTNFVETHVGHADEPSIKPLSDDERISVDQTRCLDDVSLCTQDTGPGTETTTFDDKREIMLQEVICYARRLDEHMFKKYMKNFTKFKSDTEQECSATKKRKEETFSE